MAEKINSAWTEAKRHLAGGVNSPVRAFKAVGGTPVFMERGAGPFLFDIQKKRYIDYCLSWGALILGHAHPKVIHAIEVQARKGTSFGTATEYETALAKEIKKAFPGMEKIRFTSSGTEAVMSAIRLARGVTGRSKIVKFEGCYHGHADSLLVKAGSGLATFGTPDSKGVPSELARQTLVLPYNDITAAEALFKKHARSIACVILEPVAGNMGVVRADKSFLEALRRLTAKSGALLVFDEVITGFRVAYGGAQHLYGIRPDLTILGKVIGGGLPVGAFGGSRRWMSHLSPDGDVYQAGTLSGNPLAMAAGLAVLSSLSKNFLEKLNRRCSSFLDTAGSIFSKKNAVVENSGSMFTIFFSQKRPRNFQEVQKSDQKRFRKFFHYMLDSGIYIPPSAFEASFISSKHNERELDKTLETYKRFKD